MPELTIQFLDVGQGDGIFITFANGTTMLVDLGSTKNKTITSNDVLTYFRKHTKFGQPNQTLDYLLLTHGDSDHFNMVKEFITELKVKVARLAFGGPASDYRGLIKTIATQCPDVEILMLGPNYPVPLKVETFVNVEVLMCDAKGPSKRTEAWRKNTGSLVIRILYLGLQVILAGDATSDTENAVLGILEKKFDNDTEKVLRYMNSHVLKVGHHGSRRTSNTAAWLHFVQPRFAFISSDRHGSLDDKANTGHRLPQTVTLSLLGKYSQKLYTKCAQHNVVSAFDTRDYKAYDDHPDVKGDTIAVPDVPPKGTKKRWWEQPSNDGIFTSLVALDVRSPEEPSDYDQGAQFQLSISDAGLEITSTYAPKNLTGGPIPVRDL